MPFEQWCATREDAFLCDGQVGCGVADPSAPCADVHATVFGPVSGCAPALLDAVDAGRVLYDGKMAAQCRQQARATCDPFGCEGALTGTRAVGGGCSIQAECGSGLWCDHRSSCPGVCAPVLGEGATAAWGVECASGMLVTVPDGGTACGSLPGKGDACGFGPCRDGLSCVAGRCVEPSPVGGACDAGLCTFGSSCVAGTCTSFAKRGQPCASQFFPLEVGAAACQLGLACRSGRCRDALAEGESCREEPNRCAGGTRCSLPTDVCVRLGAAGAACRSSSSDCDRLTCIDGVCSPGLPAGAACDDAHPCAPGYPCTISVCTAQVCI